MVVDASVWVSSLVAQDVHHAGSRQWLDDKLRAGTPLMVPTLALAEVAGAIARRTGAAALGRQASRWILRFPGLRLVPLDPQLGKEAADVAADLQLRGADAVYVTVAHALRNPLLTWDEDLHRRANSLIEVRYPS